MSDIVFRNLWKRFGKAEVIRGVDFAIEDGEFVVFVGPSGCGKSTLLRLVAGLEEISDGELFISGQKVNDVPPAKRGLAMVFQSYALYPHMTAYENMAFGLRQGKKSNAEIDQSVREAARILHIEDLLQRTPKQMSGGQRQRVAIGRAIVRKPNVFLFDEPLSNLDAALRVQMRIEIAKLHKHLAATMIYVTHDQAEAMTLADRIVVLRAGKVEQIGPPMHLYHRPDNQFVAGFIGSPQMNFFPGKVAGVSADNVKVELPGGDVAFAGVQGNCKPGDDVVLGIRPEHMEISLPGEVIEGMFSLEGVVEIVEKLGESQYAYVRLKGGQLLVSRVDGATNVPRMEKVAILFPISQCHLFAADGTSFRRLGNPEAMAAMQTGISIRRGISVRR